AAFPAQGVVAETLNLSDLNGYSTGGTLHLIANNQIGFTTDPADGRSTRYSSDLAKGFDIPIVHVNADDPEAALAAVRLALEFRRRFCTDVVIDLVGYRRYGHNEQDEAAYTQPLMASRIERQPGVREQYAAQLIEEGVLSSEEVDGLSSRVETSLKEAHEKLRATFGQAMPAVAYEGRIPVRLTGQDTERGTFSHRHLVLHDAENGQVYTPVQSLRESAASFEVHNSPLSEAACVGFEHGYSVAAPESLVLWEAQFGDFV